MDKTWNASVCSSQNLVTFTSRREGRETERERPRVREMGKRDPQGERDISRPREGEGEGEGEGERQTERKR